MPLPSVSLSRLSRPFNQHVEPVEPASAPYPEWPEESVGPNEIESLDYDIDCSTIFEQELWAQPRALRRRLVAMRWVVCLATGMVVGALAFVIDVCTEYIGNLRWWVAVQSIDALNGTDTNASPVAMGVTATAVYLALGVALVALSSCLILFIEPVAAGSGIPEVKAYLQGVRLPRILRVTTLICKSVGVTLSVSGGLVVGKEGPMIHAGAIVAAGISQGSSKSCSIRSMFLKRFRNDHDKRDFVSAGAAAGVAAAFGAPIGGVLFAMEEAATHWSQPLTWRTFCCALASTFTLNLLQSAVGNNVFGELAHPGLITFGSFLCANKHLYQLREFPVFVLIGLICGLLGAGFNSLNRKLTLWRNRWRQSRRSKLVEAMLIAALTALLICTLPYLVGDCKPWPKRVSESRDDCRDRYPDDTPLQARFHLLVCGTEGQSALVRLLLSTHDNAIKLLFHAQDCATRGDGVDSPFTPLVCIVFFLFSFLLGCLTYGVAVPSGLFVPAIMAGSAVGRLVGELLCTYGSEYIVSTPGSYALIGAAAMLGGICRMTISITVIVVESTTNVNFLLPISITITVAKLIADYFNDGIYDLHIHLKRYPHLPERVPKRRERLQAQDVMSKNVRCVAEVEQVSTLLKLLSSTTHNGFPVLASGGRSTVLGIIRRDQLKTILMKKQFAHRPASPHLAMPSNAGMQHQAPPLTADDFLRPWIETNLDEIIADLSPEQKAMYVNLRPYVNEAALVTLQNSSLRRTADLFRSMGLRHLLVIDSCPRVVGMITRKDILYGGQDRVHRSTGSAITSTDSLTDPFGGGRRPLLPSLQRPTARLARLARSIHRRSSNLAGRLHRNSAPGSRSISRSSSTGNVTDLPRNGSAGSLLSSWQSPFTSADEGLQPLSIASLEQHGTNCCWSAAPAAASGDRARDFRQGTMTSHTRCEPLPPISASPPDAAPTAVMVDVAQPLQDDAPRDKC